MEDADEQFHEQMREAMRNAEVLSIFFVRVGHSLIVDTRSGGDSGPAAILDEIVGSPEARLESMRSLRPGLPLPERMTLAPWTPAVREFEASGLLDSLLERCQLAGGAGFALEAMAAYRKLAAMERRFMRDLVRGVGMKTIWRRPES